MTKTIEQEALDLINEVRAEYCHRALTMPQAVVQYGMAITALSRALEAHAATKAEFEAFQREVSDVVDEVIARKASPLKLRRFIITKPDPLVEALRDLRWLQTDDTDAACLRTALAARGLKLVEAPDAD